jgi:hypothetical protein
MGDCQNKRKILKKNDPCQTRLTHQICDSRHEIEITLQEENKRK